jgi:cyclopropane-fatty-acyl-phospholipid synthase
MLKQTLQATVESAFEAAGVRINGGRAWDIDVRDERFYGDVLSRGALGLGESYMDGWWDCADLSQMFCKFLQAHLDRKRPVNWSAAMVWLKAKFGNRQRKSRAAANVHLHYDHGNELYRDMLGRWMLYSSANWEHAASLEEADEGKFEFVCQKLNLRAGQSVLDIGCGWGGFAKYAAERHGVQVVGITLSEEQVKYARQFCADLPVEIRCQDYRELHEKFDHIVSLGMMEHVGQKNYRRYMMIVRNCLKAGGLFFLNTIGANESGYSLNPWTDKYIFPGAVLPSMAQIGAAIDGLFAMEELRDWADFYDKTLMAWSERFDSNWNKLKANYSEQFYRMWTYYLLSSAGAFRAKAIQDWQIVLSC